VERYKLDTLDLKIIAELRKDGRVSLRTIAERLDIATGTVRTRYNRLVDLGILKVSALVNPFYFENSILALIGMSLESRTHLEAMRKISSLEGVLSVCNTAGGFDLVVEVFLKSRDELNTFLFKKLPSIEGIKNTHTYVFTDARNKWIDGKF
jgi:Lrp/AsnC family transcriptional regulator for asnA, asnC and gidA